MSALRGQVVQTCLFGEEITTFCCVMHPESRDFSLIWALLHDFPPFSLQICAFVREKSCNPINFSRFARLQPQKVVISSSFWPAITTPRLCLHYLTIGMKKGKNVSTFFPFFSFYFRAAAACGMRAACERGGGCARHASDVRAQWCAGQRAKAWWIVALVRGHNGVQPQLRGSHSWPRRTAELAACRTVTQDGMRRPRASPEHKKRIRGGYLNPPLIRLFGSYEGTLGWATSLLPG